MDYYDYLVDYDKWADWFRTQETKNLKENKTNKNPAEKVKLGNSKDKGFFSNANSRGFCRRNNKESGAREITVDRLDNR